MIYARVDVNFGDHPKALAAGAVARDLWTWGLLYARKHELDGSLPRDVVLASPWGAGGKANAKVAAKLVAVGLWVTTDDGWRIVNYAEKNETREQIDQRRGGARERMRKIRSACSPDVRANMTRTNAERSQVVRDQIQEPEPNTPIAPTGGGAACDPEPGQVLRDPELLQTFRTALAAEGLGRKRVSPAAWRDLSAQIGTWTPGLSDVERHARLARFARSWAKLPEAQQARHPVSVFLTWGAEQEGLGRPEQVFPERIPLEPLPPPLEGDALAEVIGMVEALGHRLEVAS